jgi:acetyl esterase/lipase
MNYLLSCLSIFLCLVALLSVIWIIFPAPAYYIWLYSVAVSEWSLWLGAMALLGVLGATVNYAIYKDGKVLAAAIIIGSLAFLISLYPLFSSLSVAGEKNVALSINQYFNALIGDKPTVNQFQTHVFARDGDTELKADVYLPTANSTQRNGASVIVIHGGSWSGGTRNDFPQWNRWLAENGFTVFDIDYRLAPQPNYLPAIGDVKSAVRWVKKHSAEFNISPDKIVLLGRSAGGHLALMSAYSANDTRLPATDLANIETENVCAVVSFYAPTDLVWDYDNVANQMVLDGPLMISNFIGGHLHQSDEIRERYLLASPIERITAATPPTLLIHGGQDQLVRIENMTLLADKLNAANIINKTLFIPYGQHGFDYNSNGWGSQITKSVMLNFLIENTQNK